MASTTTPAQDGSRELSWSQTPALSQTPAQTSTSFTSSPTPGGSQNRSFWTPKMVEALLTSLVEQVEDHGQRADTGYKASAWHTAIARVSAVSPPGVIVSAQQAKNRHNGCKADWRIWQELNNLSGFAVNEFGVVIGDEKSLNAYFNAHPEARKFRTKPLQNEDLHRRLFDGVIANGAGAKDINQLITASVEQQDSNSTEDDSDNRASPEARKRRAISSGRSRKRTTASDKLSKQVGNMAAELGELVKALSKDLQKEAIDHFLKTYSVLDFRLKLPIVQKFESHFQAKLYLSLKPPSVQKAWVKSHVAQQLGLLRDEQLRLAVISLTWEGEGRLQEKDEVQETLGQSW